MSQKGCVRVRLMCVDKSFHYQLVLPIGISRKCEFSQTPCYGQGFRTTFCNPQQTTQGWWENRVGFVSPKRSPKTPMATRRRLGTTIIETKKNFKESTAGAFHSTYVPQQGQGLFSLLRENLLLGSRLFWCKSAISFDWIANAHSFLLCVHCFAPCYTDLYSVGDHVFRSPTSITDHSSLSTSILPSFSPFSSLQPIYGRSLSVFILFASAFH